MHVAGVKVPAAPDPCRVDEADGVEHERVALPVPHCVAEVLGRVSCVWAVLTSISRDHTKFRVSATRIGKLPVEESNVVLRLEDAPRRALTRNAQRLAGHDRIFLVGPHVELLNLVPELRLVERTTQHAEA